MSHPLISPVMAFLGRLKYPQLFKLTALLFAVDMLIPDMIPFVDELLLGMTTLILANWKRRRAGVAVDPAP